MNQLRFLYSDTRYNIFVRKMLNNKKIVIYETVTFYIRIEIILASIVLLYNRKSNE